MVLVAKDIVEKEFLTLPPETSAIDAAQRMKATSHGFVIISSAGGDPQGIVTEWDYLAKIVAQERDPKHVRLSDIMSIQLVSVDANQGLDQVAQVMAQKGIRRVLVTKDNKILGVITAKTMLSRLKEYVDRISSQIARLQLPPMS